MKRVLYGALAFVLASACLAPSTMRAQLLQGVIEGNVTDSSGAAVPGAQVTVTNEQTGLTRTSETNEVGAYSFPTVNIGTFTIRVGMEGFQTAQQTNVDVRPNAVTRVNMALTVGQVSETVTVEAAAVTLQTDRAEVRHEVTETHLKNLPVPLGRNYQMLFVHPARLLAPAQRALRPRQPVALGALLGQRHRARTTTRASTAPSSTTSGCPTWRATSRRSTRSSRSTWSPTRLTPSRA